MNTLDLIRPEITAEYIREPFGAITHKQRLHRILEQLEAVKGKKSESSVTTFRVICSHIRETLRHRGFRVTIHGLCAIHSPVQHRCDGDICEEGRGYTIIGYR